MTESLMFRPIIHGIALVTASALFSAPALASDHAKKRSIEFTAGVFQECDTPVSGRKYKPGEALAFKICSAANTQLLLNFNIAEMIGRRVTLRAKVSRNAESTGNFDVSTMITSLAGSQQLSNEFNAQHAPDELLMDSYIPDNADTVFITIRPYGDPASIALSDIKLTVGEKMAAGTMCEQCKALLEYVLSELDEKYLWRDKIDLNAIRSQLFLSGTGAKTIDDLTPLLLSTLYALDPHSGYLSKAAKEEMLNRMAQSLTASNDDLFQIRRLDGDIGYVKLFGFSAYDDENRVRFITQVVEKMNTISRQPVKGWIVDVRAHGGGSTVPAITVMRRFLGKDTVGYFVDRDSSYQPWVDASQYFAERGAAVASTDESTTPVALLQGPVTASASEMLLIAFKGRPNTRFFGQPTRGLNTGVYPNSKYGAVIAITNAYSADRNKKIYHGKIDPDVMVPPSTDESLDNDEAIKLAARWIAQSAAQQKARQ